MKKGKDKSDYKQQSLFSWFGSDRMQNEPLRRNENTPLNWDFKDATEEISNEPLLSSNITFEDDLSPQVSKGDSKGSRKTSKRSPSEVARFHISPKARSIGVKRSRKEAEISPKDTLDILAKDEYLRSKETMHGFITKKRRKSTLDRMFEDHLAGRDKYMYKGIINFDESPVSRTHLSSLEALRAKGKFEIDTDSSGSGSKRENVSFNLNISANINAASGTGASGDETGAATEVKDTVAAASSQETTDEDEDDDLDYIDAD